jgi:serine acetyltransferase
MTCNVPSHDDVVGMPAKKIYEKGSSGYFSFLVSQA